MTWFGAIDTKKDRISDAMENFWGKVPESQQINMYASMAPSTGQIAPQTSIPQQIQMPEQSIKEKIESGMQSTQDISPDIRKATEMSIGVSTPQKQKGNMFDIGGLDDSIKRMMAKEKQAFGLYSLGNTGSPQNDNRFYEKLKRTQAAYRIKGEKDLYAQEREYNRLKMKDYAEQMKVRAMTQRGIAKTYDATSTALRAKAGLPIYESPWDVIAGGKRVVTKYNAEGKAIGTGIERTGGLFGATKEAREFLDEFRTAGERKAKKQSEEAEKTRRQKEAEDFQDVMRKIRVKTEQHNEEKALTESQIALEEKRSAMQDRLFKKEDHQMAKRQQQEDQLAKKELEEITFMSKNMPTIFPNKEQKSDENFDLRTINEQYKDESPGIVGGLVQSVMKKIDHFTKGD